MPEKSIAAELREIAKFYKAEAKSLFGWGDSFKEHTAKADCLETLATRCEGLVPLADVEKAVNAAVAEMTHGVSTKNLLLHTMMGLLFKELGRRIISRLTGKE